LGHATRMVPLIMYLQQQWFETVLAADGRPYDFFASRFPELKIYRCAGYTITYPESGNLLLHMMKNSVSYYKAVESEQRIATELADEIDADVVISDNRLNFRAKGRKNIYITHQLNIKAGILSAAATAMHRKYYNKFDEIWVPDNSGTSNISGVLGHDADCTVPLFYLGPQSRFTAMSGDEILPHGKAVVLLSGPEPQRTLFENIVVAELIRTGINAIVLRGLPGNTEVTQPAPNIEMISHLNDEEMLRTVAGAEVVISRPGYSTLCDLAQMNKRLIVVPTPGQTEQEYLADKHFADNRLVKAEQSDFHLEYCLEKVKAAEPFHVPVVDNLIDVAARLGQ
jgi:UDP-N-acetylglucosamine transferase subunit ALG13